MSLRDLEIRGDFYRCPDCGGFVHRIVPEGMHSVMVRQGKRVNCSNREVPNDRV